MKKLIADILIGWAFRLDPERFIKTKTQSIVFTKGEDYIPKNKAEEDFLRQNPACAPSKEEDIRKFPLTIKEAFDWKPRTDEQIEDETINFSPVNPGEEPLTSEKLAEFMKIPPNIDRPFSALIGDGMFQEIIKEMGLINVEMHDKIFYNPNTKEKYTLSELGFIRVRYSGMEGEPKEGRGL